MKRFVYENWRKFFNGNGILKEDMHKFKQDKNAGG